jgi:hypothetical protein
MRRARSLLAVSLTLTAMASLGPAAVTALGAQCDGVKTSGHWATIRIPMWPASPVDSIRVRSGQMSDSQPPVTAAVDPSEPTRLFISDGETLLRSTNGGCSWRPVFTLAPNGAPTDGSSAAQPWLDPSYVIQSIAIGGTGSKAHLYVALTAGVGYVAGWVNTDAVYIAASADGGTTWATHPVTVGGPQGRATSTALTYIGHLMASPAAPSTVYWDAVFYGRAALYGGSDHATLLVSRDSGATWSVASETSAGTVGPFFDQMSEVVDPVNPRVVWRAYDPNKSPALDVLRSTNAGGTFRPSLTGQPPGERTVDPPFVTGRPRGGGSCVVARSSAAAFRSTNLGARWSRLPAVPALDARSGRPYLEGAGCVTSDRVAVLAGYQPQGYGSPPFARSALYVQSASGWKRLAIAPAALGEGSLTVAGPTSSPAVYWFGLVSKPHPTPLPTDYLWLRYVGGLR